MYSTQYPTIIKLPSRNYQTDLTPLYSWSIIIGLVIVVLASVAAWLFSPKGETQTYDPSPLYLLYRLLILFCNNWLMSPQSLAKLPHPLVRELLPHVGDYLPSTMAPSHRATNRNS